MPSETHMQAISFDVLDILFLARFEISQRGYEVQSLLVHLPVDCHQVEIPKAIELADS